MNKVILITIDGMRPDGFLACENPFAKKMMQIGSYTLNGRTIFPSMTLPCHMSMFHSIPAEKHGVTTNHYTPAALPKGLFEQLRACGRRNAMFYGWEPLRDVSCPEALHFSGYVNIDTSESADTVLTDMAMVCIKRNKPDFLFLHLLGVDEKGGHRHGWMSDSYLECIDIAIENVKRLYEAFHEEYTIIVTADHGGHEHIHGTDLSEDMMIPMFFIGKAFEPGKVLEDVSILDITPTIASLMQIIPAKEWEGKVLI